MHQTCRAKIKDHLMLDKLQRYNQSHLLKKDEEKKTVYYCQHELI
jgi:hypothetical protein